MRKTSANMVLGCKRIHKPGLIFSAFFQTFLELCRSKVQLKPLHRNFTDGVTNPVIIYLEIFALLNTNYNDFFIFNNFLISFKRRNVVAISWNYITNKKSIKKESKLLNICWNILISFVLFHKKFSLNIVCYMMRK